ncbi:MAG: hypothetical protein ACOYLO_00185 [Ferruginibacter sp.]
MNKTAQNNFYFSFSKPFDKTKFSMGQLQFEIDNFLYEANLALDEFCIKNKVVSNEMITYDKVEITFYYESWNLNIRLDSGITAIKQKALPCEYCGSVAVTWFHPNPYLLETNKDKTNHWMCLNCTYDSATDI